MALGRIVWWSRSTRCTVPWPIDRRKAVVARLPFASWCALQLLDVQTKTAAIEQQILRQRWAREWQAEKARLYEEVEARVLLLNPIGRQERAMRTRLLSQI